MFRQRILNNKFTFLSVLIFALTILAIHQLGILVNITPSMPYGIYIKSTGVIRRGDIVALCLPEPYKTRGLERGYIQNGNKCDGSEPLIKKVIAVPGDRVVLSDDFVVVNGFKMPYKTLYKDSKGRAMDVFHRGVYRATEGYWVVGAGVENSWDSRYWGDIDKISIMYKLR